MVGGSVEVVVASAVEVVGGSVVVVVPRVVVVVGGSGEVVVVSVVVVLCGFGFLVVVVRGGRGRSVVVVASDVVVVRHVEAVVAQVDVVVVLQVVAAEGADVGRAAVVVVGVVVLLEVEDSVDVGLVLVTGAADAGVRAPPERMVDPTMATVVGGFDDALGSIDSVCAAIVDSVTVDGAAVDVLEL